MPRRTGSYGSLPRLIREADRDVWASQRHTYTATSTQIERYKNAVLATLRSDPTFKDAQRCGTTEHRSKKEQNAQRSYA